MDLPEGNGKDTPQEPTHSESTSQQEGEPTIQPESTSQLEPTEQSEPESSDELELTSLPIEFDQDIKYLSNEALMGLVRDMVIKEGVASTLEEIDRTVDRLLNIVFIQKGIEESAMAACLAKALSETTAKKDENEITNTKDKSEKPFSDNPEDQLDLVLESNAPFRKFEFVPLYSDGSFEMDEETATVARAMISSKGFAPQRSRSSMGLSDLSLKVHTSTPSLNSARRTASHTRFNLKTELKNGLNVSRVQQVSQRLYPGNIVKFPYVPKSKSTYQGSKKSKPAKLAPLPAFNIAKSNNGPPKSKPVQNKGTQGADGPSTVPKSIDKTKEVLNVAKSVAKSKQQSKSKPPRSKINTINIVSWNIKKPVAVEEKKPVAPVKPFRRSFGFGNITKFQNSTDNNKFKTLKGSGKPILSSQSTDKGNNNIASNNSINMAPHENSKLIQELLEKCKKLDENSLQQFSNLLRTMANKDEIEDHDIAKTVGWIPMPFVGNLGWFYSSWSGVQKEKYVNAFTARHEKLVNASTSAIKDKAKDNNTTKKSDELKSAVNDNSKIKFKFKKALIQAKLKAYGNTIRPTTPLPSSTSYSNSGRKDVGILGLYNPAKLSRSELFDFDVSGTPSPSTAGSPVSSTSLLSIDRELHEIQQQQQAQEDSGSGMLIEDPDSSRPSQEDIMDEILSMNPSEETLYEIKSDPVLGQERIKFYRR